MHLTRLGFAALIALILSGGSAPAQSGPTSTLPYSLYISSEGADIVTRIDVDASGWKRGREISVKLVPNEINGPHNVAVSPDGKYWYVSIAHGMPFGAVWKYATDGDSLIGRAGVGMFPTTVGLSPDGAWAYVPNSDFHGDRGNVNSVSVLYTPTMKALTEIPTCDMPHGSRWGRTGSVVYIACMMSDELVTIDPGTFSIVARMQLGSGKPMSMADHMDMKPDSAVKPKPGAASSTMAGQNPDCLATYVSVATDDKSVYVACNHSGELQIRDARTLALMARVQAGAGAYNVEPSPDGRVVIVTNKKAQSVSIIDVKTQKELARVPTSKKIPHGIAYSPDSRYVFITCESIGTDPGAVDAIDLTTLQRVASLPLPLQPTGIAVRPRPSP